MSINEPIYLTLLRDRVNEIGSIQKVADEIGISRPSVSLLLNHKYTANTDRIAQKIIDALTDGRFCPYLQTAISVSQCDGFANRPQPLSDPHALRHWHSCKSCAHASQRGLANAEQ